MRNNLLLTLNSILIFSIAAYFISCSKSKPDTTPPVVTCADKTIVITGITTATSGGASADGSISVSATGSTGFTYNNNGGVFQAAGTFSNLAAGNYTIIAKDDAGCTSTKSFAINVGGACPTITISTVNIASDKCANTGRITVTASGSTGFNYTINGGTTYQASSIFNSLAAGAYTVGVRDVNGCVSGNTATVNIATAGTLFTSVKAIMLTNCALVGCHAGATPQNAIDLSSDCTIVSQSARIKARAVDGNPSIMPATGSLSTADKQKITDWINAGGQHSN
jgi:hypothetical protein